MNPPPHQDRPKAREDDLETATLGAGCFWCLDAIARRAPGIVSSTAGYAGGPSAPADYWDAHRGNGPVHVEAVQLVFDSRKTDFGTVLELFFHSHDPTTPNQDGANRGPAYHSTIFYHSDTQREAARAAVAELEAELGRPVVTSIKPYTTFFPAGGDQQDFFNATPNHPYCTYVIRPKLRKAAPYLD